MNSELRAKGTQWLQRLLASHAALLLGFLAVACFSFSFPAARLAIPDLGPLVVGAGRGIIAAGIAATVLVLRRERFPKKHAWALVKTGCGVVIGFPLLSTMALQSVPSVHGAVVAGFLPVATAIFAYLKDGECLSSRFCLSVALGTLSIVAFAEIEGVGAFKSADVLLALAVLLAGYGYAQGARVSRDLGGWRVISWALILTAPLLIGPVAYDIYHHGSFHVGAAAWFGFSYVSLASMYLGFFAWYAALARGGTAKVGQLQLIQAPLTIMWGATLLHEQAQWTTVAAACLVFASAALTQRSASVQQLLPGNHESAPSESSTKDCFMTSSDSRYTC